MLVHFAWTWLAMVIAYGVGYKSGQRESDTYWRFVSLG